MMPRPPGLGHSPLHAAAQGRRRPSVTLRPATHLLKTRPNQPPPNLLQGEATRATVRNQGPAPLRPAREQESSGHCPASDGRRRVACRLALASQPPHSATPQEMGGMWDPNFGKFKFLGFRGPDRVYNGPYQSLLIQRIGMFSS